MKKRKGKEGKVSGTEGFCVGRVCEKTAGQENGLICVIVSKKEKNFVMIDGNVKRRKCNISHLKPLEKIIKIKKDEKTEKIKEALKKAGFEIIKKVKLKEKLRKMREMKKQKGKERQKTK